MIHIVKQPENHWMMHWLEGNNREIQSNTINHYRKGQHLRVLFFSAWEPVVINKKFIENSLCHGEIAGINIEKVITINAEFSQIFFTG